MYIEEKQEQSIVYWLRSLLPTVTVVDSFPETDLVIPTVSVESEKIDAYYFEIGNPIREQVRTWSINIFAINNAQKKAISYLIFNSLDSVIPVYDYDEGFPPDVTPTRLGILDTLEKHLENIRVYAELVEKLYYRCEITFITQYRVLGE